MINRRKVKRILTSEDFKLLASNFTSLSLLQIANYVFPLVTLPYLAKTIGVEKFGAIAFASSVIIYFQTLVDYGFHYTAVRDISKNRGNINKISELFSSVFYARIIFLLISFTLLVVSVLLVPVFKENSLILLLTFLYLPGHLLFADWFFQAIERMTYISILSVLSKFVFTVLVFVLIKTEEDYILQPVLTAVGYLVSGVISFVLITKRFKVRLSPPNFQMIMRTMRGGLDMFLCLLFPNFYTNFSVILLRLTGGEIAAGIYSSGEKFISLSNQFSRVLSRTFFPFLARRIDQHSLYKAISGIISLLISILLFFSADLLVTLFYTPEFEEAVKVIRIMSLSPIFLFLMETYGTNYLVLVNRERTLRNIIIICSLFGFVLSWFFVIKYSFVGAAISIMVTWLVRGGTTWYYASKVIKQKS